MVGDTDEWKIRMNSFWEEWGAGVVVLGFVMVLIGAVLAANYFESKRDLRFTETVEKMGFPPIEVEIFLGSTNWDFEDFIDSQGVRKCFERFYKHGDMSGIVKTDHDTTVVPVIMPVNMSH